MVKLPWTGTRSQPRFSGPCLGLRAHQHMRRTQRVEVANNEVRPEEIVVGTLGEVFPHETARVRPRRALLKVALPVAVGVGSRVTRRRQS